jgi:hypothetical protein
MAQSREIAAAFQQSSPDSSKRGAGSLQYDGTPDTRLTFSPDEGSACSSKAIKSLGLSLSDPRPTKLPSTQGKTLRGSTGLPQEKDPFVTAPVTKSEQKLSATASAFRPFTNSVLLQGSNLSVNDKGTHGDDKLPQQSTSVYRETSTDLLLSRCLVISSPSRVITVGDIKQLFTVSLGQFHYVKLKLTFLQSDSQNGARRATEKHRSSARVFADMFGSPTYARLAW